MLIDPTHDHNLQASCKGGDLDNRFLSVEKVGVWVKRFNFNADISSRLSIPDSIPIQKENLYAN